MNTANDTHSDELLSIFGFKIISGAFSVISALGIIIYALFLRPHFATLPGLRIENIWLLVAYVIISYTGMLTFSCYIIRHRFLLMEKDLDKKSTQEHKKLCASCCNEEIDKFDEYCLVDYTKLLSIEASLREDEHPEKCCIFVYASSLEHEIDARREIEENIKKGIQYKVLYFDKGEDKFDEVEKIYQNATKNNLIQIVPKENTIDYALTQRTAFGLIFYKDSKGEIRAFACVNFTGAKEQDCPHGISCGECDPKNNRLFYKQISKERARQLVRMFENKFDEAKRKITKGDNL